MRLAGRGKLDEFVRVHADARRWVENWIADAEAAEWRTPDDIRKRYATASFLAKNVVIFNVRGNHYRLEALVAYKSGTLVVRWIGTHAEYDKR